MTTSSPPNGLPPMDTKTAKPPQILPMKIASWVIKLFSSHSSKRSPPSPHKTRHIRLITIAVSHFCEKARWGLDILETDEHGENPIYYTEDGHAPAFASFATLPASNYTSSLTPMIVVNDDERAFVSKSDVILQEFCPFLYPQEYRDDIIAFEDELGTRLGAAGRCAAYWTMLDPSKNMKYYSTLNDTCCPKHNTSDIENTLHTAMLDKGVDKGMMKTLHVNADTARVSFEVVRKVFAELSERLDASKSNYFYGDQFTAADLTFASLAYFIIHPPEMDRFVLPDVRQAPEFLDLCKEMRETTAGKHVLRMYSQHRPVDAESGFVVQKSLNRNRKPFPELALGLGAVGALSVAICVGLNRAK